MSNDKTPENNKSWVERMQERGTIKPYNDDNNKAKGKSLYETKPAATSAKSEEPPKQQPPKQSFVERIKQQTSPPTKTPPPPKPTGPKK